jgi:hypothetical protein
LSIANRGPRRSADIALLTVWRAGLSASRALASASGWRDLRNATLCAEEHLNVIPALRESGYIDLNAVPEAASRPGQGGSSAVAHLNGRIPVRLYPKALAVALGLIWGAVVLCSGSAHLSWRGSGGTFLELIASIYPGTHTGSVGAAIIATLCVLIDGAACGSTVAWLYNLTGSPPASQT